MKLRLIIVLIFTASTTFGQILNYEEMRVIYYSIGTTKPASLLLSKDFTLIEKNTSKENNSDNEEVWAYNYDRETFEADLYVIAYFTRIIRDGKDTFKNRRLKFEFPEKTPTYKHLFTKIKENSIKYDIIEYSSTYVQEYLHKDRLVFRIQTLVNGVIRINIYTYY